MTQQQSAMRMAGYIIIGFGLLFAASVLPALHPVVWFILQVAYWPMQSVPSELLLPVPLLVAISGGLIVGLGGTIWALAKYVAPVSPEAASRVAQVTAWSWFCTDSVASVLVGAPFNVVLNLFFLVLILVSSRTRLDGATATS